MNRNPFSLNGKRALVTGASKGIGLGIAEGLANAGANLILVARNESELEKAREDLPDSSSVAISSFDLQKTDEIAGWFAGLVMDIGPVDILINNAGMNIRGPTEEYKLEDWRKNHQYRIGHDLWRTPHRCRLRRIQGRDRAVDEGPCGGVGGPGHPRERDWAGIHQYTAQSAPGQQPGV